MVTSSRQCKGQGVFMKGHIQLSVYINHGLVTVHVIQGRHLTSGSQLRLDTYVMISLIPDDDGVTPTRCRTSVVKNSNSPTYNEKFSFEISEDDVTRRLLVSVWVKNSTSRTPESLGCMSFGVRHLQSGERPVSGWYHLLATEVGCKKHLKVTGKARPTVPVMQSRNLRPTPLRASQISKVNQVVPDDSRHVISVLRSPYGSFGFSLVDSCPVKVGRVDGASRAQEAGLQPGDLIVRVNNQNVSRSTSSSVARCIKRSGDRVDLEVHRPFLLPSQEESRVYVTTATTRVSDETGSQSVHVFTLCGDTTSIVDSAMGEDMRRQAALHRLLCLEENFVDLMTSGIHGYSRPLRHFLLSGSEHQALFQNIEKLVSMSEYQVQQIVRNLPDPDDEDPDCSFTGDNDITFIVAMIYMSKLPLLCQAYTMYAYGLERAVATLSQLETRAVFRHFLSRERRHGRSMSLVDFISRPIKHLAALCEIVAAIEETTIPGSRDQRAFSKIVQEMRKVVDTTRSAEKVISAIGFTSGQDLSAARLGGSRRRVPIMGSLVLKRASSSCSSSGFGSGGSEHSEEPHCAPAASGWYPAQSELRQSTV